MAQTTSESTTEDYVYIDLDRPSHWWSSLIGAIAIVLIVGVLVAPWAIDWSDPSPTDVSGNGLQGSGGVCRPDNSGLPGFFDPSLASWSRFCDWFIEPDTDSP